MSISVPKQLVANAYQSMTQEYAWPKKDALCVVEWASQTNVAVFGVEVWLPTTPGPTIPMPFFYGLSIEPEASESWDDFVSRANAEAISFIRSFEWDDADIAHRGKTPFFNLTLGEE